ncbi:hypothetical protein CPT32_13210 [Rhizobium sophoriradicis]|uniref:hypothetical protein n=1 Tax=Rhizobium sophoriradicis TaxID=1535245 RepID=UPI000BBD5F54|nr:hypothetical protein [Rhizobium sophoriradicis]PCK86367.1 hypothetical protein CPT32_13210 [Rhizobium sophoriradicis]
MPKESIPAAGEAMPKRKNSSAQTTRPLKLQLLDISDLISNAASLVDALDMATNDIIDTRQRNALAAACDVLMGRMDHLKGAIEAAREEA